jgi:hypothetical protein
MKVACLMGTYGRFALACEALSCFLQQSAVGEASLLIYNQHPVPLAFEHPRVRVVNEVRPNVGLRQIKARMVELADPDAEFIHFWDDDDLVLPWHLRTCLDRIGDSLAWKPARSWTWYADRIELLGSHFEATCLYRASFLRAAPLDTHPGYGDHPGYMQLYDRGLIASADLGALSSYLYRWATGSTHVSLTVGASADRHAPNLDRLRAGLTDTGAGRPMQVAELRPLWEKFLLGIRGQVSPDSGDEIEARLDFAGAMLELQRGL